MTSARKPQTADPVPPPDAKRRRRLALIGGGRVREISSDVVHADSASAVEADLDALLEETKRERDEYLELAQRARADFDNYRKRAAREAEEAERRGRGGSWLEGLVPALDNLERALLAAGVSLSDDPAAGKEPQPRRSRRMKPGAGACARLPRASGCPRARRGGSRMTRPASGSTRNGTRRCRPWPTTATEAGHRPSRRWRRATGSTSRVLRPARVIVSE